MAIYVNIASFELLTGCSFWLAEGWYGGGPVDELKSVVCVEEKYLKLHKNANTFQAATLTN